LPFRIFFKNKVAQILKLEVAIHFTNQSRSMTTSIQSQPIPVTTQVFDPLGSDEVQLYLDFSHISPIPSRFIQ
jgi:hypothetical protein